MKAARIHAYGGPEEFRVEEAPRPIPGPHDVLIEVRAAAVNPVDCKMRSGYMRAFLRYSLPLIMGLDLSGVVVEVGAKCSRLKVGDEVYASPGPKQIGTYAEFAVVNEEHVGLKPSNLTHLEAAGIPLAGLTAWDCLQGLKAGQRVLILAGSGGVGTLAIQLAKERGAEVITTCSARNSELVRGLGADQVIDYTQQDFGEVVSELDMVLDAIGDWGPCRRAIRRGGSLRTICSGLPEAARRWGPYLGPLVVGANLLSFKLGSLPTGVKIGNVLRRPSAESLAELTKRIEAGSLRPVMDQVFPLEEIVAAHERSESGRARGKIVIEMGV